MKNSEESLNSMENQKDTTASADSSASKDNCQECGATAEVGVIGLGTHDSYCNSCYNQMFKSTGKKVN